jgi:hypothetical protein
MRQILYCRQTGKDSWLRIGTFECILRVLNRPLILPTSEFNKNKKIMDRDKMSNLYRGPSIHGSYQGSVHLAARFQRRLKCEKLMDDRRQVMAKAHVAFGKVR